MIESVTSEAIIPDLLHTIEEDRLAILCGAGLSMAPPSNLASAAQLAQAVYDKCQAAGETVPNNLEQQAEHFLDVGRFSTYFIGHLIPQDSFAKPPNPGHSTIADFLLCKAISTAVSANYDVLIEHAGRELFGEIDGLLDGVQAENSPGDRSPLLKIHGCWTKAKDETVWTPRQLDDSPIRTRIEHSRNWLNLHLRNKELLVVGFWSDWSYLNSVLDAALGAVHPAKITIVDLSDTADLETKAPGLCALEGQEGVSFRHVQESGAIFLEELRKEFSRAFCKKAVYFGRQSYIDTTGNEPDASWYDLPIGIAAPCLYDLRRDIEGREPSECARNKEPDPQNTLVGLTILQLRAKGAVPTDGYWLLDGRKIRVLRTARLLHAVKEIFSREVPPLGDADIVICVGAEDIYVTSNIAREETPMTIVRGGPAGEWLTRARACEELGL